jgi:hypothetical protein
VSGSPEVGELSELAQGNEEEQLTRDIDEDSGCPFIRINHPAPGDVIRNPAHVAGYGTAFEGTISLQIRDDDGTIIAEGSTQGGSYGVIGEFKADLEFDRRPNQRLVLLHATYLTSELLSIVRHPKIPDPDLPLY